ncbi:MAG: DMT family transporter [Firmicutes bacterium]|nr:DMT family transporter [Bacillota bacterium]
MKLKTRHTFFLFITAFIWGTAFVAQSVGLDYLTPLAFNGIRTLLGGLVLLPGIWLLDRLKPAEQRRPLIPFDDKLLLKSGVICGVLLGVAGNLQQMSLQFISAGKCGFITAFYIILVPIYGLFLKRRCPAVTWPGVVIALVGLYLLCIKESFTVGRGDLLVFACAAIFAGHIMVIDHYSPLVDGVRMSCVQFFVAGGLSLLLALLVEDVPWQSLLASWRPVLYAGVLSCGVAYTLQVVGQNGVEPAVASLILSLESVFSVLAGWIVLHEALTGRELAGCLLMFVAILLVQVVPALQRKRPEAG